MKKMLKYSLIGLVAVVLIIALSGNSENGQIKPTPTPEVNFQEEMASIFIDSCIDGREEYVTYCNCCWAYMVDNYGFNTVLEVTRDFEETGEEPDILWKAINSCLKYIE